MQKVKIDCEAIPALQMNLLSQAILEATKAYFSEPENLQRFEEWQRRNDNERAES